MAKTKKKSGKNGKKKTITPRNLQFIENYINSGNATQAYIEAGYTPNGAEASASRMLTNVNIIQEIEKRRLVIANKNDVTAAKIINEWAKMAFLSSEQVFDYQEVEYEIDGIPFKKSVPIIKPHSELSEAALASVSSIKEGQNGLEIKLYDKQKALVELGKYRGISNEAEILKAREIKKAEIEVDPTAGTGLEARIRISMEKDGFEQ